MSRKKDPNGVQATVERLTGKKPCPDHLRAAANKYLDSTLFTNSRRSNQDKTAKLNGKDADILLHNALFLDEPFKGQTSKVVSIIKNDLDQQQLNVELDKAQHDIERRFEIYAYWKERFPAIRKILTNPAIDLTRESLNERLKNLPQTILIDKPLPFALRAVQHLETIEELGQSREQTANEYAEQADAYLALGVFDMAAEKAIKAINLEPHHATAWFVRVMVAVQQRNLVAREMKRLQLISSEIADPMSSQESWAFQMADDEAGKVKKFDDDVNEILPKALLHWPRHNQWQYDHPEQYKLIRNLFIDQAFSSVMPNAGDMNSYFSYKINGLEADWINKYNSNSISASFGKKELQFSDDERTLLAQLINERDKYPSVFFDTLDFTNLGRDFKLLHLRWLLALNGYEKHWHQWSRMVSESHPINFENSILRDDLMSRIWQVHQCMNGRFSSLSKVLADWQHQKTFNSEIEFKHIFLRQYTMLFHRNFVLNNYVDCFQIACVAEKIANDSANGLIVTHTGDEMITLPAHMSIYWKYLKVLSVIKACMVDKKLEELQLDILIEAPDWQSKFQKSDEWFWKEHMMLCEEDVGSDYQVVPYEIDLREAIPWQNAINAQLVNFEASSSYSQKMTDALNNLLHVSETI